ncbi:YheT family hydrolase [Belliella kenyensis]|uniref:YheT family hydrolase n=1 Tax=Belliella kenyensis TaxID=1472724 RepID=A0ABV8EK80_9BACT|nr:alpha/beta fold hydrolase [Belliella kenyensis]MCH7403001.1 alpha/beta fold hydrolase [Belliella kenyensis]MDN3605037.1 alpha/beta fold hydrolase [Belliella kenyensis]
MPLLKSSPYQNPKWLFNGHLQTIVPSIFRKINLLPFERERITTKDGDFIDLDWLRSGSEKLVIISHGLEGNSRRPYMVGMAHQFFKNNFDVLNWNFRGCSEEMNKKLIFYHSGATYDLKEVIDHASSGYKEVFLIGFSLGGNLTLKYLGETDQINLKIKSATAISVPLHLESSCEKISSRENIIYARRFLKTLKEKITQKSLVFPNQLSPDKLRKIKTLKDFDDLYTGPIHGFDDAHDYYEKNSSLYFIEKIKVPTLILNAQNDPFLSPKCYPVNIGHSSTHLWMEFPKYGGHVGFSPRSRNEVYWSEKRAFEFITSDH